MAKYKNVSNISIMVYGNGSMQRVMPNEVIELPFLTEGLSKVLTEVIDKNHTQEEVNEWKDLEESQASDLPEDMLVVIEDSIVEELKKESNKTPRKKGKRNTQRLYQE